MSTAERTEINSADEAARIAFGNSRELSTPRVWVLNLDAEHELEVGRGYAPTQHIRAIVAREQTRLLTALLAPGDFWLRESESDGSRTAPLELLKLPNDRRRFQQLACEGQGLSLFRAEFFEASGLPGLAWSPTPRALAQLQSVGARPLLTTGMEILRTVNARSFAATVRMPLQGDSFDKRIVSNLDEALTQLAHSAPSGWLVRRSFGAAGRGRRRLAAGNPSRAEVDWLVASLRRGPLVLEPWVEIETEFTRSGWVESNGSVILSRPCFQKTTESGAWLRTEHAEAGGISRADDERLAESFETVGRALIEAGYVGPFGIDAYRHTDLKTGRKVLNPLSEINARFTMDWSYAVGSGDCANSTIP